MISLPSGKTLVTVVAIVMLLYGCHFTTAPSPKKFRIGFSQCTGDDKWRKATVDAATREISFHPGAELLYRNADDNSNRQIEQIRELEKQKIDILLVSPNEAASLTPVVKEIYDKGIPVVILDRRIASDQYTAFVGAGNYAIGKTAAAYITALHPSGGRIIQLVGLEGSTPATERRKGFEDALSGKGNQYRLLTLYGDWIAQKASDRLMGIKDSLHAKDIVFAQNDPMAFGAYQVYKKLGLESQVQIVGVDGLAGPGGGIEMVADSIIKATLLSPTGAEEALQVAFKILEGVPFKKENILSSVIIDSSNVRIMKAQTDKINAQQKDINGQQEILVRQQKMYENQSNMTNVFMAISLLVMTLAGIGGYALWRNKKINRRIVKQHEEILLQRNQLIEMTAKAKEATEAKLNFFTGISHEFRTPLTLILGPLEDTLSSPRLHHSLQENMRMAQKNVMRLLRLINQLMDYRKSDEGRMQLSVTENDLVRFTEDIVAAFRPIAAKHSIALEFIRKTSALPVWFDTGMLDKVLFNLLSNAFKFCTAGGYIRVTAEAMAGKAILRVEDSGIGMEADELAHVFEPFFQGNHRAASMGTGLGLALSRQLVELHGGTITVTSEKGKGTSFEIQLPLGKEHFRQENFRQHLPQLPVAYDELKIYASALEATAATPIEHICGEKEHSVLVVEDDPELRNFLVKILSTHYEVTEAENGKTGLEKAFEEIPDLVISDIIMPSRDGLGLTELLKQDVRTSHIPVVLLSARGSMEDQLQGIRKQADAFIVKPFNIEHLLETIQNLLKNRLMLMEHYASSVSFESRSQQPRKTERKFLSEFSAIVERNIDNEKITAEDISHQLGISRVQLNRKIKALTGAAVSDYLLQARLQKARYLLTHSDKTIFEIACAVGFSSQAYFSTVFKTKFQVTPTEFREGKYLGRSLSPDHSMNE